MQQDRLDPASVPVDWVLVANAARARCFLHDARNGALQELSSFVHPASRLKGAVLEADRGGQVRKSAASTQFAPHTGPHEKQLLVFAHELAAYLEDAARAQRYPRVSLIVSKEFLGELRAQLGSATRRLLGASVGLDLTACQGTELEHRVTQALQDTGSHLP